nr:neutral ceramidase 2-like [Tanacetum cinerariifolium]
MRTEEIVSANSHLRYVISFPLTLMVILSGCGPGFSNVNESVKTCPTAIGFAFAAGTTDGTGAFDFTQGDDQLVGDLLKKPNEKQIKGRDPKPILIDSGKMHEPYDWAISSTCRSMLNHIRAEPFQSAYEQLKWKVGYRHSYIDFSDLSVRFSNVNESVRTCPAAMGFAFAAGTTDGTGAFDFTQGDDQLVGDLLKKPDEKQIKGRDPKPILIDSGEMHEPYDWVTELITKE